MAGCRDQCGRAASRLAFTRDAILSMDSATSAQKSAIQVGDTVQVPCFVNVLRAQQGAFVIESNADVEIASAGQPARKIAAAQFAQCGGRLLLESDGTITAASLPKLLLR